MISTEEDKTHLIAFLWNMNEDEKLFLIKMKGEKQMDLKEYGKLLSERALFCEGFVEKAVEELLIGLKEKGITKEEELLWYKSFLKSAIFFLGQSCNADDQTIEGVIKLCESTKPDEITNKSTYDIMLQDWYMQRANLVRDYQAACFNKLPENPSSILEPVLNEWLEKTEHPILLGKQTKTEEK